MPPTFEKHVFICTASRPPGHPKGCCNSKGSAELLDAMKMDVFEREINDRIRINSAGCLDSCENGPSLVVYPEGVWYKPQSKEDVLEIVEKHLVGNEVVDRLLVKEYMGT